MQLIDFNCELILFYRKMLVVGSLVWANVLYSLAIDFDSRFELITFADVIDKYFNYSCMWWLNGYIDLPINYIRHRFFFVHLQFVYCSIQSSRMILSYNQQYVYLSAINSRSI